MSGPLSDRKRERSVFLIGWVRQWTLMDFRVGINEGPSLLLDAGKSNNVGSGIKIASFT